MKTQISFSVVSDLFDAGPDEDGRAYHAEVYYVQAEHADGRRWTHPARFHGAKRRIHEDSVFFQDLRAHARKQARAVMRIAQVQYDDGGCDLRSWEEAPCAYGSAAYGVLDEYDRMDEEERARCF